MQPPFPGRQGVLHHEQQKLSRSLSGPDIPGMAVAELGRLDPNDATAMPLDDIKRAVLGAGVHDYDLDFSDPGLTSEFMEQRVEVVTGVFSWNDDRNFMAHNRRV